jgi:hypothetical protein
MLALAAAVACGIGATAAVSGPPTRSPQSFGAAARTVAGAATPSLMMLLAGQIGSSSQVPRRLAGPAWTVAEATTGNVNTRRPTAGHHVRS